MKSILIIALLVTTANVFAQQKTFDIINYTPPAGWEQKTSEAGIQFLKDDAAGNYCVITLFKSSPATADAKENFSLAWTSLVKDVIQVADVPEMSPSKTADGFDVVTGHTIFERDSIKGIAILVSSTGFGKMANILILTNTELYEQPISTFLESVTIRKPAEKPATSDGYTFNTTNFDDGWTSTVQEDWVQVIKGGTRVLVHYPNRKADVYNSDLLDGLKNAWQVLVAPRYSSISNLAFKPVTGWEPIEWAEADALENASGQQVHIVLFKKNFTGGAGRYIECITSDKNSFELEFGADYDKLAAMANYNKFAVAAADLTGQWTTSFTGATQYVNIYTGLSAGMNTHSSTQNFQFNTGNKYSWDIAVASGMVGNLKFQGTKSAGKFSVVNNWQIHLSDIEGKPKTYNVAFTCIKGARVLWIDGSAFYKKQ